MTHQRFTSAQMQQLEQHLEQTNDVRHYRRILALLMWGRGSTVAEIASLLNMHRQSVYNWIATYTQSGDPARLRDADRPGRPPHWTTEIETSFAQVIAARPDQLGYLAVNWTVPLLQEHLEHQYGILFSDDTIRRALHRLGYVWKRYRYVLDPDPQLEKKRQIRRQLRALGPRSVVLAEDETDLLLFPPIRAGWALRGEVAEVRLSGWNARRVISGAMNLTTGHRLFLARSRQRAGDFQAFLQLVHRHYRAWQVRAAA